MTEVEARAYGEVLDEKNTATLSPDCTSCKHFCSIDKMAFYKVTGRKCPEYKEEAKQWRIKRR